MSVMAYCKQSHARFFDRFIPRSRLATSMLRGERINDKKIAERIKTVR